LTLHFSNACPPFSIPCEKEDISPLLLQFFSFDKFPKIQFLTPPLFFAPLFFIILAPFFSMGSCIPKKNSGELSLNGQFFFFLFFYDTLPLDLNQGPFSGWFSFFSIFPFL